MEYKIYCFENRVEHAIFSKTKDKFYKRFKSLMSILPVGDYSVYTVGDKRVEIPFFEYKKVIACNGLGDTVRPFHMLSRRKGDNIAQGVF